MKKYLIILQLLVPFWANSQRDSVIVDFEFPPYINSKDSCEIKVTITNGWSLPIETYNTPEFGADYCTGKFGNICLIIEKLDTNLKYRKECGLTPTCVATGDRSLVKISTGEVISYKFRPCELFSLSEGHFHRFKIAFSYRMNGKWVTKITPKWRYAMAESRIE